MKKKAIQIFTIGVLTASVLGFNHVLASSGGGGTDDPVATKSYVDQKIIDAIKSGSSAELSDYQLNFIIDEVKRTLNTSGGSSSSYTPVNLLQGQTLIGYEGTEIILRSGEAKAYTEGADGLVNVTSGEDMTNGTKISKNNLLIVPRSDSRGVTSTTNSWFIVKGDYFIQ